MKIIEVVHITWIDSEALADWTPIAELEDNFKLVHTIGILIHSSPEMYVIASSYDPDLDAINAAISIPAKCVDSIDVIYSVNLEDDYGNR